MPHLSVEQKNLPSLTLSGGTLREANESPWRWMNNNQTDPRWCFLIFVWERIETREGFTLLFFSSFLHPKTNKKPKTTFLLFFVYRNSFTDLSVAGLPAELKHITQRRKRKQPWFPQSAASEEGPNSLPNRVLKALSCGNNAALWLVREWRNSSAKQTHCWIQPFMWVLSQRRC